MSAIESTVMVNPINDSNTSKTLDSDHRLKTNSSSEKEAPTEEINEVNVVHMAKQLARLKEFILSAPEVNKMRVEFFKEELANGRYSIQCQNIATNMFRDIEIA